MILLAALPPSSSILHTSYQLPFLGIIALLLVLLGILFGDIFWRNLLTEGDSEPFILSVLCLLLGFGLSIYGIAASVSGLILFLITIVVGILPTLLMTMFALYFLYQYLQDMM